MPLPKAEPSGSSIGLERSSPVPGVAAHLDLDAAGEAPFGTPSRQQEGVERRVELDELLRKVAR